MVTFRHDETGTSSEVWRDAVADHEIAAVRWDDVRRLVVVAAHPDDETLGAGGLVARCHDRGLEVHVVVATRGEASHPSSPTHDRTSLGRRREQELRDALSVLAPGSGADLLDLGDGAVEERHADLTGVLVGLLGDGRDALVVAPWREDGHPDHEAAGRAAAVAARRTGAHLLEYPVWAWHWAAPPDLPWSSARRLDLTASERDRKQRAIRAHRTQVEALSSAPGDEVLLAATFLEHFATPYELFWALPPVDDALDELHRTEADPWGVDHRWYEERKRALVLAMLPRRRFRRTLEVGCSTGALTAALADRTDALVAVDASEAAVRSARHRLREHGHVDVVGAEVPRWWIDGPCDLVVLSEVGYFLSPHDLEVLAARVRETLTPDGVVVLAHWRHPIDGWPLDGPEVHARLRASGLPPVAATYVDRDVEVLVLAGAEQVPDPGEGVP